MDGSTEVPLSRDGRTAVPGGMVDLVISTEARHHARGWDTTPATLYRVFGTHRAGRSATDVHCDARAMPLREMPGSTVPERLVALAERTESLGAGTHPLPVVAHMFVTEAWMRTYPAVTLYAAEQQRARRDHADLPGSIEVREAVAVGSGYRLQVHRRRGHRPRFTWRDIDASPDVYLADGALAAVIRIHRATVGTWR